MLIDEVDTPCLAVDLDVFERNVALCMERLAHVDVRPHQKTAKSPDVAHALVRAGARGICVAKLSEAEVMLAAGIDDVLITTELAGPIKARRLAECVARFPDARIAVVVDSVDGAATLDAALLQPVDVLIEVNVAQNRCGVAPEEAAPLADALRPFKNLRLVGLQGYEGNLQLLPDPDERQALCDAAMERLATAAEAVVAAGHRVDVVTTGGTGTAEFCARHAVVTEVQPGSFVFTDASYLGAGGLPYSPALLVHATVISHPTPTRAVIDAGLKTLTDDLGPARLHDTQGWTYAHGGDEHGILTASFGAVPLAVGDRVTVVPSHGDTTVNLHDVLYAHRDGVVEAQWPVAARGKVQ